MVRLFPCLVICTLFVTRVHIYVGSHDKMERMSSRFEHCLLGFFQNLVAYLCCNRYMEFILRPNFTACIGEYCTYMLGPGSPIILGVYTRHLIYREWVVIISGVLVLIRPFPADWVCECCIGLRGRRHETGERYGRDIDIPCGEVYLLAC